MKAIRNTGLCGTVPLRAAVIALVLATAGCAERLPTEASMVAVAAHPMSVTTTSQQFFVAWSHQQATNSPILRQIFSLDARQERQVVDWADERTFTFARANPGRLYILRDEPDQWCTTPTDYAIQYREFVKGLLAVDPSARVSPAGFAEPNTKCCPDSGNVPTQCWYDNHSTGYAQKFYDEYVRIYSVPPKVDEWRFHDFAIQYKTGDMDGWWGRIDQMASWSVAHGGNMYVGAWGFMIWYEPDTDYNEHVRVAMGRMLRDPRINGASYWSLEPWDDSTHPLADVAEGPLNARGVVFANPLTDVPGSLALSRSGETGVALTWANTTAAWGTDIEYWSGTGTTWQLERTDRVATAGASSDVVRTFQYGQSVKARVRYFNRFGQAGWSDFSPVVALPSSPVPPGDMPPTARFTTTCGIGGVTNKCTSYGGTSTDDNGIALYSWDFGDGVKAAFTTPNVTHTYPGAGPYNVTLTVKDAYGQTGSMTVSVSPGSQAVDLPPVAAFTFTCTGLTCSTDASASTDDKGISSYAWDFGDGTTGSGKTAAHTYAAAGTYQLKLTVKDALSQVGTTTKSVVASAPPAGDATPVARFTTTCGIGGVTNKCTSYGGTSTDDKGIVLYSWDFGDGVKAAFTTPNVTHTFPGAGPYNVTLTVKDASGQTGSVTKSVSPGAADLPPVAAFTLTCLGKTCSGDASTSTDDKGISSYSWDFGDGTTAASGKTAAHIYATAGTYQVKLTVWDALSQTGTTTKTATVTAPPPGDSPPAASFTTTCGIGGVALKCTSYGGGSTDDKGVAYYSWNLGDGVKAMFTTPNITHTYPRAGTYVITLTVVDGVGQIGSVSRSVNVGP